MIVVRVLGWSRLLWEEERTGFVTCFLFEGEERKKGFFFLFYFFKKIIANSCSAVLSLNDESNFYSALMKDMPLLSLTVRTMMMMSTEGITRQM